MTVPDSIRDGEYCIVTKLPDDTVHIEAHVLDPFGVVVTEDRDGYDYFFSSERPYRAFKVQFELNSLRSGDPKGSVLWLFEEPPPPPAPIPKPSYTKKIGLRQP